MHSDSILRTLPASIQSTLDPDLNQAGHEYFARERSISSAVCGMFRKNRKKNAAMLLNYLYAHFDEESQFVVAVGTTSRKFLAMIESRIFPSASYVFESKGRSISFVAADSEEHRYLFHHRSHRN